jgi:small-conductance mechanosensitive channel
VSDFWDRLAAGAFELGGVLPAVIGALVILLTGYLLAKQLERWIDRTLKRTEFRKMADAGGLTEAAERAHLDPVNAVGKLVFWLMMLLVILLASTALGLENINQVFGLMLSFIPTLIAGIVIVVLGIVVGEFVRGLILASAGNVSGVPTLAKVAKTVVVVIAVFMALQQMGVAEEIVTSAFTLILGAVALAVGLSFGLGNRELAGEITRRWYEEGRRRNRRKTDLKGSEYESAEPPSRGDGSSPMLD